MSWCIVYMCSFVVLYNCTVYIMYVLILYHTNIIKHTYLYIHTFLYTERNEAIRLYKEGIKDVLVATDIAAKGLDFPDIQHVINFDMPTEIENYVHRIGRTGRCGKTGVATTFINKDVEESALLDLKHLLVEAKQRVPPVSVCCSSSCSNSSSSNSYSSSRNSSSGSICTMYVY